MILETFAKINALLDTTQFSADTKEIIEDEGILSTQNGQELVALTTEGEKIAAKLIDDFNEISSSATSVDSLFMGILMLIEKSKAEGYRTLAKIAAAASLHV